MQRFKNETLDVPERLEPHCFPIDSADHEATGRSFPQFSQICSPDRLADIALVICHRPAKSTANSDKLDFLRHQRTPRKAVTFVVPVVASPGFFSEVRINYGHPLLLAEMQENYGATFPKGSAYGTESW